MHRLFVALRPPGPVRARLLTLAGGIPGARWQDDDQLHLTLRFLGEMGRPQAEDVAAALGGVHAPTPRIAIAGVGRFDKRGRTDTLWAGVTPHEPLVHIHRKVDAACARAGIARDSRAYLPHITLARFARAMGTAPEIDRWVADHAGLASDSFAMTHLTLVESRLGREGARYEAVARWPLD